MEFKTLVKESFCVIGKEIFTWDGDGLIPKVWVIVDREFAVIEPVILKDENGRPLAKWGAMSSKKRDFSMWEENGSVGLYLAGYEAPLDAEAPKGWTKWIVPGYEYLRAECDGPDTLSETLEYMGKNGLSLVGAVHDFTCPQTGGNAMFFPIRKL